MQKEWELRSTEELEKLIAVLINIPNRRSGRTKEHKEGYVLGYFLKSSCETFRSSFPLRIIKTESPDFVIESDGRTYGLEITELVHPDYAEITNSKYYDGAPIHLDHFRPNTRLTIAQKQIAMAGKPSLGLGLQGDEPEIDLAHMIATSITKKVHLKTKGHFRTTDEDMLLIYDNFSWPDADISLAKNYLVKNHPQSLSVNGFKAIYILFRNRFISLSPDACRICS